MNPEQPLQKQANTEATVLEKCCKLMADTSAAASSWVIRNPDLARNESEGLIAELRRAGRLFRRCGRAAARRMCAGVFGPSQAGKSYLISALARGSSSNLEAKFGAEIHDFLAEINPEGGKESTGLVTRFTLAETAAPAGYPVLIRMLSEMDLVKIIANSWFADCEHSEAPDAHLGEKLAALKDKAGEANGHVSIDDLEELREYLRGEFSSRAGVRDLERGWWSAAIALAPLLEVGDRIKLYSLIWNENSEFTALLGKLLMALEKLGHPDHVFCDMDALVPRKTSIIDVATLAGLEDAQSTQSTNVCCPDGLKDEIPSAVLAALAAELVITMAEKPADFFDHTDLLDFPGYRSRLNISDADRALKNKGMLSGMFLRGKVAYLFQHYCSERELNSMILCIGPGNQEVRDLPRVINDWVVATHGATPAERDGKTISLLVVLTKFDMEFEEKKGATDLKMRWDIRLDASFLDYFGKEYDWPTHWTPHAGFNNIFLLRNPNFKFGAVLEYNGDVETGIKDDSRQLVGDLHAAFMNSKSVAAHFRDPARAWDEAMRLNDGGVGWIRQNLAPLCDPRIKEDQLLASVDNCRKNLLRRLEPFYRGDDHDKMRKQKILLVKSLFGFLGSMEKNTRRMGELLRAFTIADSHILDLHAEASRRFREQDAPDAQSAGTVVSTDPQTDEDLDSINFADLNPFSDSNIQKDGKMAVKNDDIHDEASFFATCIENAWVEKLHKLADNPASQNYFMLPARDFSALATELATGASRFDLYGKMCAAFRKAAAYSDASKAGIAIKQAAIAARIINDYVNWLGFQPATQTDAQRTVHLPGGANPVVFSAPPALAGLPELAEDIRPYTSRWLYDWLNALAALIMGNVDYDGEQTINVEENAALGHILGIFAAGCGNTAH